MSVTFSTGLLILLSVEGGKPKYILLILIRLDLLTFDSIDVTRTPPDSCAEPVTGYNTDASTLISKAKRLELRR